MQSEFKGNLYGRSGYRDTFQLKRRNDRFLPECHPRSVTEKREPTRQAHLSTPGRCRKLCCILPVTHPADKDWLLTLRQVVEADGAVVIFSVVGPAMRTRLVRLSEALTVK